jgi:Lon protease-like protein
MHYDDAADLEHFGGIARLFPLPNLVLFPSLLQALHIFEPRYRQMTADALAGDKLFTMALLKPGWETDYEGRPAIHSIACLGKILNHELLPDGRYNLQLRGLRRVRVVTELDNGRLYRSAQVEVLADTSTVSPAHETRFRRQLAKAIAPWCPSGGTHEVFAKLLKSSLPLGTVSDILSFALPLEVARKQVVLETLDVGERVQSLLTFLKAGKAAPPVAEALPRDFPPPFSTN